MHGMSEPRRRVSGAKGDPSVRTFPMSEMLPYGHELETITAKIHGWWASTRNVAWLAVRAKEGRCDLGRSCGEVGSRIPSLLMRPFPLLLCTYLFLFVERCALQGFDPDKVVFVLPCFRSYFSPPSCAMLCSAVRCLCASFHSGQHNRMAWRDCRWRVGELGPSLQG